MHKLVLLFFKIWKPVVIWTACTCVQCYSPLGQTAVGRSTDVEQSTILLKGLPHSCYFTSGTVWSQLPCALSHGLQQTLCSDAATWWPPSVSNHSSNMIPNLIVIAFALFLKKVLLSIVSGIALSSMYVVVVIWYSACVFVNVWSRC